MLLDFLDLVVVGGHVGFPWIDEVISLADKCPNVYVGTSAYMLTRLPLAQIEFMRGRASRRVMFGTNWPMLSSTRALKGLDDLGRDADACRQFLGPE